MTGPSIRHEIAHLARVEVLTPDPEGTRWFFTQLLGMYQTRQEGQSVFLRGYEDPYQWSIKITEAPEPGMGHAALRASSAEALQRRVKSLRDANVEGRWSDGDFGYGQTWQFQSPDGHQLSLVWEAEKYQAPPELRSPILTRPSKKPLQGLPVKRIDHLNLMASDVRAVRQSMERHLGFATREQVKDGDVEIGAWMSTNLLGHEVACMRDTLGERGRLHHVAMYYGIPQHNIDAAEMFREYGIEIECGPDKHGITQGSFLYVFEPGGNRVELFGDPGILQFEPDYETRVWSMAELANGGLAIGGATLPWETYFTYGTPNKRPLAEHRAEFAHAGPPPPPPPPPPVKEAKQGTPDAVAHSAHT